METGLGAGAIVDSDGFELGRGTWLEPDLILCVAMISVPCGYGGSLNTNLKNRRVSSEKRPTCRSLNQTIIEN
jgi:hypothetical protein